VPVTAVTSDPEALTLTVVGEYPVPVERLWEAYVDPHQLERFWGPPEWPARFLRHDMVVGGRSEYVMTGPDGTTSEGFWVVTSIDRGRSFAVVDGFIGEDGEPNPSMPTMSIRWDFESTPEGSRFTSVTTFPDLSAMEKLLEMGVEAGMRAALGQADAVLADLASFAAGRGIELQLVGDTQARISRLIRGTVEEVWNAHHDPALVRQWMLGPDGWEMPICEVATQVGERFRYGWARAGSHEAFGFEGELLESTPPVRAVTTERMAGEDGPSTRNELTLTPVEGGALMTMVVTYPDAAVRDAVLATGMVDGMERSYERLDGLVRVAA
jgi:uncharacterized protein YndB with AHSA1/START domain